MTPWAQVRHRSEADVSIVDVSGEIDIANVGDLREQILQCVPNTAAGLVLDLRSTRYMDSQGMRLLVDLADSLRRRRQRFAVVAPSSSFVYRIIELTQLNSIFPVTADVAGALASIERR